MYIIQRRWKRVATILLIVFLTLSMSTAFAAAPNISLTSTQLLTSTANSVITYTGYMNGESFQQNAITTYNGWQYATYWNSASHVVIARRQLPSGAWQNIELTDYTTTSTDSHNVISMGISKADGTIHLAFDMHDTNLKYRKSVVGLATNPASQTWAASQFGATQSQLTGTTMTSLTYPAFINAPGNKLQFAIRVGVSGSGDEVLYEYSSGVWTYIGKFIDGTSSSKNAYMFGMEYDNAGRLHASWTWRETPDGSTNHDIMYAYSDDQGRHWKNNAGTAIATSGSSYITPTTAGAKVWTIAQNRGLMNQESQVVDSSGVVHVMASHLPNGVADQANFTTARNTAVIFHYYRDTAGVWHEQQTAFLESSSRGDIVADSSNNLYMISGDSTTKKLHVETASQASGWTDWTIKFTSSAIYFSDPQVDHERIKTENKVSIFSPQSGSGKIDILDFNVSLP